MAAIALLARTRPPEMRLLTGGKSAAVRVAGPTARPVHDDFGDRDGVIFHKYMISSH